jgi:cytochrome c553
MRTAQIVLAAVLIYILFTGLAAGIVYENRDVSSGSAGGPTCARCHGAQTTLSQSTENWRKRI